MQTQTGQNRVLKEIADSQEKKNEIQGVEILIVDNDITHWRGYIDGPSETVYEGGFFQVDIKIPSDYPYKPPQMKFDTQIWHPNISSQTGDICLKFLKWWSPALTIRNTLLSLQAMLSDPQADCPQDAIVAAQFKNQRELFNKTAKLWTQNYASKSMEED